MWTPLDLFSFETWALISSIAALAWYFVHRKWQYLKELNVPHDPPSLLQFGHVGKVLDKEMAFQYDNQMKKKHGPIWGSYTFLSPSVTIHDPDMLRQIFIKEFHYFPARLRKLIKIGGKELNEGLTVVEGSQWKRIRSSLTPTFSTSKIRQMIYIMDRCTDNAAAALDRNIKSNDGVFNSKKIFSRLSLDIICSSAFSTEVNSQDDTLKEPEIAKQARNLFSISLYSPWFILCALFPPFESLIEYFNVTLYDRGAVDYFKAITNHVINSRETDSESKSKGVDLMQLMLNGEISEEKAKSNAVEKGMDRNEIIGNSMLMILAGYENTGNTMSFFAYSLAQYPEIQRKLQKEIDESYQKKGKFDYDSVSEMKYLDMCLNETLRLYNPTLRNARICDKQITINGFTIPKGMQINVPTFALSRDPDYWEEPDLFKPDRMEDMSQIDNMVYQPFGGGPRNCIAMRFALMEVKFSIAKLLHQFNLEPTEDTPKPPLKLALGLAVRPAVDYNLRAVRRHQT